MSAVSVRVWQQVQTERGRCTLSFKVCMSYGSVTQLEVVQEQKQGFVVCQGFVRVSGCDHDCVSECKNAQECSSDVPQRLGVVSTQCLGVVST